MPDLRDIIEQRRSIRKYLPREVPFSVVLEVLEAAGWAASAHNSQPWRFIVLADAQVKRELADRMAEAWVADLKADNQIVDDSLRVERVERFANAPVLIMVFLTLEGLRKFPDEQRQKCERDLAVESLGAALENLLLATHAAGLGACWFCAPAFCKETVRTVLNIPYDVEPSALITLGYAAEKPPVPLKKALKDYCYLDTWGKSVC